MQSLRNMLDGYPIPAKDGGHWRRRSMKACRRPSSVPHFLGGFSLAVMPIIPIGFYRR